MKAGVIYVLAVAAGKHRFLSSASFGSHACMCCCWQYIFIVEPVRFSALCPMPDGVELPARCSQLGRALLRLGVLVIFTVRLMGKSLVCAFVVLITVLYRAAVGVELRRTTGSVIFHGWVT